MSRTEIIGDCTLYLGDCREVLPTLAADSFDSCVTDPPYHLTSIVKRFGGANAAPAQHGTDGAFARASRGFMGKQWDGRRYAAVCRGYGANTGLDAMTFHAYPVFTHED